MPNFRGLVENAGVREKESEGGRSISNYFMECNLPEICGGGVRKG
jgi:hypothetical protein